MKKVLSLCLLFVMGFAIAFIWQQKRWENKQKQIVYMSQEIVCNEKSSSLLSVTAIDFTENETIFTIHCDYNVELLRANFIKIPFSSTITKQYLTNVYGDGEEVSHLLVAGNSCSVNYVESTITISSSAGMIHFDFEDISDLHYIITGNYLDDRD